jgi:hypothetical protein
MNIDEWNEELEQAMKTLSELRALVRSPSWQSVDRTDQLVRSIQQSMRVEGYDVDSETVLRALEESRTKRAVKH